jgi:glycosyltransferase involved in cell wall biosynthesis
MVSPSAPPPHAWNVCTGLEPALAGLYRGILDFARALDAPVVSFGASPAPHDAAPAPIDDASVSIQRIACGPQPPGYDALFVGPAADRAARRLVAPADLLVAHSLFRGHVGWTARTARRTGAAMWSVPHGCLDPRGLAHRWLAKRAWLEFGGGRALERAEVSVFATHRERDKAAPWTFSRRTAVVPWPLALPDLGGRDAARERFRGRLGLPGSAGLLLSVARLHSVKRPRETVAAFCTAAGPDDHLVVVGGDDDVTAARLRQTIPEPHRGRVHLVGPLHGAALHEARLAADGFISLSLKENFCYAFAEALAYGLPAIVSPGHDLAWELPQDRSGRRPWGWLLPDDTPRSAAEAVAEFVRQRRSPGGRGPAAPPAGAAARAWLAEHCAAERFRARLLGLR